MKTCNVLNEANGKQSVLHQELLKILKNQDEADLMGRRPIITREYWLQMIKEVQNKIDELTTKKALSHSSQFRNK